MNLITCPRCGGDCKPDSGSEDVPRWRCADPYCHPDRESRWRFALGLGYELLLVLAAIPIVAIRRVPRVSGVTALLAVLTVAVQVAAIWMVADPLQAVDAPAPVETAENDASTAVPIVVLLVLELVVVWLAWLAYVRLPGWLRRWVRRGLVGVGVAYALVYALAIAPALLAVYAAVIVAWMARYRWLAYDIAGVTLGVVIAATLGGYLGPVPLIVLLVALMAYDWFAVVETGVMDRVVRLLSGTGLPVMVIVPKRLDLDLRGFLDALAADGADISEWRDRVHTVVGVGDFAIPAALATAAFRFHGPEVALPVLVGTVIGMVLLGRRIGEQEALPGLPWLGGGALGGYAGAVVVVQTGLF